MLNGGAGIAHLNMNNSDNRVKNLKRVKEGEARKMLMDFEEISVDQAIKYVANYCITNNLYRQGNTFHEFDDSFVNTLNAMFPNLDVDGGSVCLYTLNTYAIMSPCICICICKGCKGKTPHFYQSDQISKNSLLSRSGGFFGVGGGGLRKAPFALTPFTKAAY